MSMNTQIDLSKICGRKISDEEATRIREVASNLELRDDDALWQLLAAIEYQKTYYEKIPKRIENASNKLLENVQQAAEKEVEKSQAILAKSVVDEARGMAKSIQWGSVLPLIIIAVVTSLFFGSITMWAGYQLGSKEIKPLIEIFKMPVGLCLGSLLMVMPFLYITIIYYIKKDVKNNIILEMLCGIALFLVGYVIFAVSGGLPKDYNIINII